MPENSTAEPRDFSPPVVTAQALSATVIRLSWTAVEGATHYRIFRGLSPTGNFTQIGDVTATRYLDTGLASRTAYYYYIVAFGNNGVSNPSAVASATTLTLEPPVVHAVTESPTAIRLYWTPISGATQYNVYRSAEESGPYQLINVVSIAETTDTDLTPDTEYFYKISAWLNATEGPFSAPVSVRTLPDIPAPPTDLTANGISVSAIELRWAPSADTVDGYRIYRSDTPDGLYRLVGSVGAAISEFTDTVLQPDTAYYYKVSAFLDEWDSVFTPVAAASTLPSSALDPTPTARAFVRGATICWTPCPNARRYAVYRKENIRMRFLGYSDRPCFFDADALPDRCYLYRIDAIVKKRARFYRMFCVRT